jgi:hypothetical protein
MTAKNAPKLTEFLLNLASQSRDEIKAFWEDEASAKGAMRAAGLSHEQQEAILSRDERRIQNAVAEELDNDVFPKIYPWIVKQHMFMFEDEK